MNISQVTKDLTNIAKKAGDKTLEGFGMGIKIRRKYKKSGELVTSYDTESEKIILDFLSQKYPDINVLSEETGFYDRGSKYTFVIDPLDGTTNFSRTNPFYGVSIALVKDKKPLAGVIYAPYLDEMYIAVKNKGAKLNGKKIKVSKNDRLEKAFLVSCEGSETDKRRFAKLREIFTKKAADIRKLGAASLECAYVARGSADGYISLKLKPWDAAAGALLVCEAGGKATDFKNSSYSLSESDILVSNSKLHSKLWQMVKNL